MARIITPALLCIAFCLSFEAKSINYVTLNSGNWNDVTSVWSTDGGTSPCGCNPGTVSGSNNITVNHTLSVPSNLNINGGTLTVNVSGQMNGSYNLTTSNATITISGSLSLDKYTQGINSSVNMNPNAILIASNSFLVANGSLTLDGALINSGAFSIDAPGVVTLNNSSRFFVVSGNTTIDGQLNINSLSCTASNGNFKVGSAGSVLGTGSLNSGGNLNNSGFVAPTILWCAQGTGLGMSSPENCAGANGICNAILLPIELISFDAKVLDEDVEIFWSTASERNNSHFIVQYSFNGSDWKDLELVEGAGTTTSQTDYSIFDDSFDFGVKYYRLIQFDLDGKSKKYNPVSVERNASYGLVSAYPNPVKMGNNLTLINLQSGTVQLQLLNNTGRPILFEEVQVPSGKTQLVIPSTTPGFYILQIVQEERTQSIKLMVME